MAASGSHTPWHIYSYCRRGSDVRPYRNIVYQAYPKHIFPLFLLFIRANGQSQKIQAVKFLSHVLSKRILYQMSQVSWKNSF